MVYRLLVGVLAAGAVWGQDYFPLQAGNQWIYRQTTGIGIGSVTVVSVTHSEEAEGRTYSVVEGFEEGDAWLRWGEGGTLYRYDTDTKREMVWAAFMTTVGNTYATEITPCNKMARVTSRSAIVQVPAGEFGGALAIVYPPSGCADAGLTNEAYAPYIGLIHRVSTSIAGPRTLVLIYARIGGVTVLSEAEVAMSVTVSPVPGSGSLTARLTLRTTHAEPLELLFSSGQRYDFVLKNEQDEVVWQWSRGKFFTQSLGTERLGPGEKNWVVAIPMPARPGNYSVEAWLTTMGERRYAASTHIAVAGGQ